MMGVTHAGWAALVWTAAAGALGFTPETAVIGSMVAVGAGVAPDLDEPQSSAARSLGTVGRAGLAAARTAGGYRHRGPLTHSLLAAVGAAAATAGLTASGSDNGVLVVTTLFVLLGFGVLGGRQHRARGVITGAATAAAAAWLALNTVTDPWWLPVAVGTGWVAHVTGDAIVGTSGVPMLWPVHRGRLALGVMKVGGIIETAVVLPAVYLAWAVLAAWTWVPESRELLSKVLGF